jgi:hypothetical protein
MPRFKTALIPLLAVLLVATAGLGTAVASHNEAMFFEAPRDLVGVSPKARAKALGQLQWLGVKALRVELTWRNVAPRPTSARRPRFDATNPASYNWGEYDALLAEAQRLKWQVLLTVTAPVPKWATAAKKDYVTHPSSRAFEEFMTAVGRHYGGEVSLFAIWNEPNHPAYLRPQFLANGRPASPRIYRALFQAGYEGLKASGMAKPKVLMGETAPTGSDSLSRREARANPLHDVAPLAFLREALCLDSHYRKSGTCEQLQAYGYAHHAYTTGAGPTYRPPERDDVMIGVLSRLSSALDRAAAAHAIPAHLPIYLTEFGVQSYPNHELGVPQPKQAEFDAISEKIAWSNPRVAAFSQYLLRDDKLGGKPGASVHGGFIGFQTGLEEFGGKRKPLYYSFPVPLVVSRHGHSLWGLVRPATGATSVTILYATGKSGHYRKLKAVQTDASGAWSLNSSVRATHWRVLWVSPAGVRYEGPPIG